MVLQVGVEQVLQAAVQAEADEQAVEVEAEEGAVPRDGGRRGHHPPSLSQPPQQLLQICQLLRDEQAPPGGEQTDVNPGKPTLPGPGRSSSVWWKLQTAGDG